MPEPRRWAASALAGLAGASLWVSLGTVAVTDGLGLAAMAYGLSTKVSRRAEPVWTVMAGASAVAVMFATSVVWARQSGPVVTPSRSQVAALGAWQPSWQTTRFSLRPFRALAEEEFMRRFAIASTDRDVRSATDSVLLAASLLPAADYEIVTEASARMSGAIAATAGRSDQPIERWRLDGRSPGFGGVLLPLPIPVQSVTIRGDIEAVASAPELTLRVKGLRSRGLAGGRSALRAARYGRVRVFFVDDRAFMEPTGFWTRAEDSTTVVIDADEDARTMGLTVVLRTGLVATTVEIVSGAWSRQLAMPAQQTQRLVLPPPPAGQDAWVVTLRTGAGFRPFDQDPANQDVRNLGVWVEVR